jgi:Protein of unknown function (DUF3592)
MSDWLPAFLDPPAAWVIAQIAGGTILLGLVALVAAMWKYLQVAKWPQTAGTIIRSEPGFEVRQRFKTERPRNERVAKIAYTFEVNGKKWHSGKILDSGHPPEDQVERLLAAYPKDAAVMVYYNPSDPSRSALEIDRPPKDLAWGCLSAISMVIIVAAIGIWIANAGLDQLHGWFPNAVLPAMLATACLGVILAVGFFYGLRHAEALRRWPQVNGQIVQSSVHQFQIRRDEPRRTLSSRRRTDTNYMPVVEYKYLVGGRQFSSRSVWADTEVSGSLNYAKGIAARYPVGATVTVHYDPEKPSRSALEVGAYGHWFLLAGAAVAFACAAATSGLVF